MKTFEEKLLQMKNIEELLLLKKEIKDRVHHPMHWEERMELYAQVQLINKQIEKLNKDSI